VAKDVREKQVEFIEACILINNVAAADGDDRHGGLHQAPASQGQENLARVGQKGRDRPDGAICAPQDGNLGVGTATPCHHRVPVRSAEETACRIIGSAGIPPEGGDVIGEAVGGMELDA